MKEAYVEYYKPLVQQFCKSMQGKDYEGLDRMPHPFLPLFGKNYEDTELKFLIIGQDTKGWGNVADFVKQELEQPGQLIAKRFWEIDNIDLKKGGKNTHSFIGFAAAILASLHGIANWNVLKWGKHQHILSSFAWGNANAVILKESLKKFIKGVPLKTWEATHAAGEHFNRFRHMLEILKPRVVLITVTDLPNKFFDGLNVITMKCPEPHIRHYRLEGLHVDIFHTRHPNSMRWVGGPLNFLSKLKTIILASTLVPEFPDFISADDSGDDVVSYLMKHAPRPNGNNQRKYEFVTWVADTLTEQKAFMSVPCLVQMANELGYRTNYGTTFSGGRGSYRLVRGAYHRCVKNGEEENARQIAEAFRKPDFTYAY